MCVFGQSSLSESRLVWGARLEAASLEAQAMALDSDGTAYFIGRATIAYPHTNRYGTWSPGGRVQDGTVVVKTDNRGILVWSSVLWNSRGHAIAVDAAKNVYVTGDADGASFPTTTGAFRRSLPWVSAFVVKLNPSGILQYSTLVGSDTGFSSGRAIAVDRSGYAYVAGSASYGVFPTTPGAFQRTPRPEQDLYVEDGFVTKLNTDGSGLLFSTLLGGSGPDRILKLTIDSAGSIYVFGDSSSADYPVTAGAYRSKGILFVTKLNSTASALTFSTFVGDEFFYGWNLAIDASSSVYVAGSTYPLLPSRGVVRKLHQDGTGLVYERVIPSNLNTSIVGLAVDAVGNVLVAGHTSASDIPIPQPCFLPSLDGAASSSDFLMRLDPSGRIVDGGYPSLSGPSWSMRAIDLDSAGNVYVIKESFLAKLAPGARASAPLRLRCIGHGATLTKSPLAAGEVVSLFGEGIGPDQPAHLETDASGKVTTALGGTQVFFDGLAAPLLYAQARQINAVVPWEITNRKTARICVVYRGESTNCITAPVAELSPGIFRLSGTRAAVLNHDGSANSPGRPAVPGTVISLFVTGSGPSIPPQTNGEITYAPLPRAIRPVQIRFRIITGFMRWSNVAGEVLFHGPAPNLVSGVTQINVRLPGSNATGDLTLRMESSAGEAVTDSVQVYIGAAR